MSSVRLHLHTRLASTAVRLPHAPSAPPWNRAFSGRMAAAPSASPAGTWAAASSDSPAGTWAEVQHPPAGSGFRIHPAAGDACLHLAALPGSGRSMGATRRAAPLRLSGSSKQRYLLALQVGLRRLTGTPVACSVERA